MGSRGDLE